MISTVIGNFGQAAERTFPANFYPDSDQYSFQTAYHAGPKDHLIEEARNNYLTESQWTNFLKDQTSINWGLWVSPRGKNLSPLHQLTYYGDFLIAVEFYDEEAPRYEKNVDFEALKNNLNILGKSSVLKSGTAGENALIQHPRLIRKIRFLDETDLKYFFESNRSIAKSITSMLNAYSKKELLRLLSSFLMSPLIDWNRSHTFPKLFHKSLKELEKPLSDTYHHRATVEKIKSIMNIYGSSCKAAYK